MPFIDIGAMRNERETYITGGISYNNNLKIAQFEFNSVMQFVESNCLTVFQYKEFISITNRYFECLLIGLANYEYERNHQKSTFSRASSTVKELTLEVIQKTIPYIKIDNVKAIMSNYRLSKIKLSSEAINYIIDKIKEIVDRLQNNVDYLDNLNEIKRYIEFISIVNLKDMNSIISILENYSLTTNNASNMRKLLRILVDGREKISNEQNERLSRVINSHLEQVLIDNILSSHGSNFDLYVVLLNELQNISGQSKLALDRLKAELLLIEMDEKLLSNIIQYRNLIIDFYKFFDESLQIVIKKVIKKYEKIPDEQINIDFVKKIILAKIYSFKSRKELVLNNLTANITADRGAIQSYPDPRLTAISELFSLVQNKYFTLEQVKEHFDLETMRGEFPEVDWVFLEDRSDEVISRLLEDRSPKNVKKYFCKTKRDKKLIDTWILEQVEKENVKFINNLE
ncbi:hypothetical protein [Latilactobacillus fuchuensis]|uniref:Uncharacterized protein n=1 Tax=Latilactobacillus fuchuensis TaxID=164393 RepID=A0A2N9DY68_9LACO|nr:hypothetical protein [Latilactobacillus fuchuensis]SPC40077.1 hypothetical protein LFUMFP_70001 [Latilactobacillus fuchuensis]